MASAFVAFIGKHVGKDLATDVGVHTTDAASDVVTTRLKKVLAVVVSMESDPADGFSWVSAVPSGNEDGKFTLKSWQNTSGTDPTPAAAAAFSKKVHWIAIGY